MTLARRLALFGLFLMVVTAVNASALSAWFRFSRGDSTASHLVLIPLVTLVLIFQDRKSIFAEIQWAPAAGVSVVLAGAVLMVASRYARPFPGGDSLTWAASAIAILWFGGFLLFFGWQAVRAALFPLLFLAFMIPFPQALLNGATQFLKTGSAETVAALFALTGTPYFREGFVFSLPNVVIEVADECSGIRSSIALLLTSLLASDMFLSKGWNKALLVLAAFPIAVLKNGIRIVSLTLLAIHVDPGFLAGQLHHEGGIVFFLLSLAILSPVLYVLRRFEPDYHVGKA
jgi:exosortase